LIYGPTLIIILSQSSSDNGAPPTKLAFPNLNAGCGTTEEEKDERLS
jgi:hypothetical protein